MEQIKNDNDMEGMDGELYVIGVCATDGWTDEDEELDQIDYWKDTDFEGTEWCGLHSTRHKYSLPARPLLNSCVRRYRVNRVEFKCGGLE